MRQITAPENTEYSTLEKVRAKLRAMGLQEPEKPEGDTYPECPLDLSSIGGDAVTTLQQEFNRWYGWVSYANAVADEAAKEWASGIRLLEKTLIKKEGMSKDETELDLRIIAMRHTQQLFSQEATLTGVHKSILDRYLKATSRVIEVIRMNLERGRRGGNMGMPPWKD